MFMSTHRHKGTHLDRHGPPSQGVQLSGPHCGHGRPDKVLTASAMAGWIDEKQMMAG